ncbi:hypothetical protein RB195_011554 [Necator americanus]|uniref:Uncharacterized protein n=1 Tax=Necator americanus TaxID=51031 RepID=A0ABR1D326_NECAM
MYSRRLSLNFNHNVNFTRAASSHHLLRMAAQHWSDEKVRSNALVESTTTIRTVHRWKAFFARLDRIFEDKLRLGRHTLEACAILDAVKKDPEVGIGGLAMRFACGQSIVLNPL